ncbi:transmembrane and coiled-coil domain-containing protein 6 isoform X2 [Denticeps clupeoides]|uniref:Transmembrane and coiled-coil domain-containing protein 6 n=1 Tax=Denticeps clupeoides TaxID=299321 RepID=A0AAY4CJK9_9TELE|nr:transmembrane and coiled-coil domain-containing protein 6 isoform X2 [Denticeps clupeoides]
MWRLRTVGHKARGPGIRSEEFKLKRREREKVLRQARRDRHLVSKRLLLHDYDEEEGDEEHTRASVKPASSEQVVEIMCKLQTGGEDKATALRSLRNVLRSPEVHVAFIRLENSVPVLVGLLSGSDAQCRVEAAKCLHQLSHSPCPNVGLACLPATPYLLTYLSGQRGKFTELCLYTLGNLCAESEPVRERLQAQGIVMALVSCIQNHGGSLAVLEAVAFTLSQLLQAREGASKVAPLVLTLGLIPHLVAGLTPDPEFGIGAAIECAWCLHYLASCEVDKSELISQGVVSRCSSLLITLEETVAQGDLQEGLELLIWPLVRCLGNLLASSACENTEECVRDTRVLSALCGFSHRVLQMHPALTKETLWVVNNLTADSPAWCSALLSFGLLPGLLQLLPLSLGINCMVLRIVGNVAHKGSVFSLMLTQGGLLPPLCATLKMADPEVVTLSLEVLYLLVTSSQQAGEEFVKQNGQSVLEMIQYSSDEALRQRAAAIVDLLPQAAADER